MQTLPEIPNESKRIKKIARLLIKKENVDSFDLVNNPMDDLGNTILDNCPKMKIYNETHLVCKVKHQDQIQINLLGLKHGILVGNGQTTTLPVDKKYKTYHKQIDIADKIYTEFTSLRKGKGI